MFICTPIKEKRQKDVLRRLKALKGKADLAEVWLDQIENPDLKNIVNESPLPLLMVCKKPADGGRFKGTWEQMAERLTEALEAGAAFIDIPLGMPSLLSKKIVQCMSKRQETRNKRQVLSNSKLVIGHWSLVIFSYHNFQKTPPRSVLLKKAREMKARGADIVKIAVMARSMADTFSILFLAQTLQAENIPHILIAMGKKGILSRILSPFLGGTLMFAPLTAKEASASGQLTVKELREAWKMIFG